MSTESMSWTQRPWTLKTHTVDEGERIGMGDDWTVMGGAEEAICIEGFNDPNAHANAHLIAASPDLAAALLALFDADIPARIEKDGLPDELAALEMARAALRKAGFE